MQGRARLDRELLDAEMIAGHLVPAGSVFAFLAEHRAELFPDSFTADLFPSRTGRPSVPADLVGSVLVLKELRAGAGGAVGVPPQVPGMPRGLPDAPRAVSLPARYRTRSHARRRSLPRQPELPETTPTDQRLFCGVLDRRIGRPSLPLGPCLGAVAAQLNGRDT
jgi:hypothetical protein